MIGLAISVISVAMAVYFYRRTDKRRIPTFVVSPARRSLVLAELANYKRFSLRYNGEEVGKNGVTAIQVYFWNSGSLEILSSHVLRPYSISISAGPILSWSVIKTSRELIHAQVVRDGDAPDILRLSFEVLEPGDGTVLDIIYDGPPDVKIEFDGACVGSSRPMILPSDPIYFSSIPKQLMLPVQIVSAWAVGLALAILIAGGSNWLAQRILGAQVVEILFRLFSAGFIAIGILAGLFLLYRRVTLRYIPPDIRPR